MHQIMRVTHPLKIPIGLVIEILIGAAIGVELIHQALRGKPLALHKIALDLPQRAGRQFAQARMIIKDRHQRWLAVANLLPALG